MDFARYEFCKENNALLAQFLKKSREYKWNDYCNHEEYAILKKIIPNNEQIDELLIEEVIDITQSDEEHSGEQNESFQGIAHTEDVLDTSEPSQRIMNKTSADDICYAIKEDLETEKCLSTAVICNLHKSDLNLEETFLHLSSTLDYEEVLNFGLSLQTALISDERIVLYFVRNLLMKQLAIEYSDQLQSIYNDFCQIYSNILMEEISNVILQTTEDYSKVFLQYLERSGADFKLKLFRNFIFNCDGFRETHIPLIEALHSSSDIDSQQKLVELMSMSANNYSTSKPFGKLILNVIKILGKNINLMEKPINHIIATHKSVWKGKIQKLYNDNLQDSILITQSFRY